MGSSPWVSKESDMTEQLNDNNLKHTVTLSTGLPCGSAGKESTCNEGDLGSIPGLGRSPGAGSDNPLQYSCLENPIDRGARQAMVHAVTNFRT